MKACKKYVGKLEELISGGLTEAESSEVRLHLERCPGCKRELETLRKLNEAVALSKRERVPEGYWESLQTAILEKVRKGERARRAFSIPFRLPLAAGAAVAAVLVLLMVAPEEPLPPVKSKPFVPSSALDRRYAMAHIPFPAPSRPRYLDRAIPVTKANDTHALAHFSRGRDSYGTLAYLSPQGEREVYW